MKQTLPPALSIILSIPQFLSAPQQYCVGKSYELSALGKYMLFLLRSPVPKTSCRAPPVPLHHPAGFQAVLSCFCRDKRRKSVQFSSAETMRGWQFVLGVGGFLLYSHKTTLHYSEYTSNRFTADLSVFSGVLLVRFVHCCVLAWNSFAVHHLLSFSASVAVVHHSVHHFAVFFSVACGGRPSFWCVIILVCHHFSIRLLYCNKAATPSSRLCCIRK